MEKTTDGDMEMRRRVKRHFSVYSVSQAERIMKILEGSEEENLEEE
ncbi:MAG: hypothetical protein HDS97_07205 [Bacteroidales bacterium]|nr:hypothetical protein [Bacteroidales bacterium]